MAKAKRTPVKEPASALIGKAIEAPSALPPMPATAEQYAGINDIDTLAHRLFELRRRQRLYAVEEQKVLAEIGRRVVVGASVLTSRYRLKRTVQEVRGYEVGPKRREVITADLIRMGRS